MNDDLPPPAVDWQKSIPLLGGGAVAAGAYWTADQMRKAIADEREACAALVESRAGMRGTGAWVALTAAAEAIRERGASSLSPEARHDIREMLQSPHAEVRFYTALGDPILRLTLPEDKP